MRGAALVALAAALGNMLQGASSSPPPSSAPPHHHLLRHASDHVGRRPMLVASSLLYALAGLLMLWSPPSACSSSPALVDGFAVGLAVTPRPRLHL
ncbi:hypothetical protein ZWY2020_020556 [Hordeum vulgare]|nr:hypothetical protein ZWY2020_020556 [Hordeum vulgare]